ncbi:MAG TPA: glycosyltransferase [Acidisoma sp.]|uniref:glycosyltransferase family 2 protein n=1 Tax=Acidisoma sp. TaxID=1872115 RepID=UPI002D031250|nr:glycosyltransferase [Acidisoma sp.]HTI02063.1 glycosyltransferase [Acidisoma sp.]
MPEAPEISAILTTHNRAHLLPRVLEGFCALRLPPDRYELLVVDDGSSDGTAAVLDAYRSRLPMRVVRQNAAGLAAAKNLGIFMSRSPILLFVDDDDVPSPDLLTAHLSGHLRHRERGAIILGRTVLAPEIADLPLMRHVSGAGSQLFSQGWMQPGQKLTFREFWGGRSSVKRALLTEFGVFNPVFRFGCEDIELAWRLERVHGLNVIYEPTARTTMIRGLSFDDFCRRSIRQGRSQWVFACLHPDEDVRAYCEIDQGLAAWSAVATDFAAILRRVRGLDRMMQMRGPCAPPLTAQSQVELDAAYREAFFLCRAKGIADAARLPAPAQPLGEAEASRLGLLDRPASLETRLSA